jgi:hypothetical protein
LGPLDILGGRQEPRTDVGGRLRGQTVDGTQDLADPTGRRGGDQLGREREGPKADIWTKFLPPACRHEFWYFM